MSFMTHAAHGSASMGKQSRKVISDAAVTIQGLGLGKYIIHGRFGDGKNSVSAYPAITGGPIEFSNRWPASVGYVMLIDVDTFSVGAGTLTLPPYDTIQAVRKITIELIPTTIPQDTRLWNDSAAVQGEQMVKMGIMKWEQTIIGIPSTVTAGVVNWTWGAWQALTSNVAKTNSLIPHTSQTGSYVIEVSIGTNWVINDYNPAYPIILRHGISGSSLGYLLTPGIFDGIVTITLNSIAAAGTPTFATDSIYPAPSWVETAYTATAGKRGRLILDYSGGLVTILGIDLPSTTTVG